MSRYTHETYHLIGRLRQKMVEQGLLPDATLPKTISPTYENKSDYQLALNLADYISILISMGMEGKVIFQLFSTTQGIHQVQSLLSLNRADNDLGVSKEVRGFYALALSQPELREWVQSSFPESVPQFGFKVWLQTHEFELAPSLLRGVLPRILDASNPLLKTFLEHTTVQMLAKAIQPHQLRLIEDYLTEKFVEMATWSLLFTWLGKSEADASWGERLSQYDLIMQISPLKPKNFYNWELQMVDHEAKKRSEVVKPASLKAKNFRSIAGVGRNDLDFTMDGRYRFGQPEYHLDFSNRYPQFDRLEDERNPTVHLLPLAGVEVRGCTVKELMLFHGLIEAFVARRGDGSWYEISAPPTQNINTLLELYKKFIESGFIDTLLVQDLEVHWNITAKVRSLVTLTYSILLLTGYLSEGRIDGRINNESYLVQNNNGHGEYFEWKQGDMPQPEVFFLGAQIWHAIFTAQKAYEEVMEKYLFYERGIPKSQLGFDADELNLLAKNPDLIHAVIVKDKVPHITPEQRRLAYEYSLFRRKAEKFLHDLDGKRMTKPIADAILSGTTRGMEVSGKALIEVFPDYESFLYEDPKKMKLPRVKPWEFGKNQSLQQSKTLVAFAQKLTTDTMHAVNKVTLEADETYLTLLADLANSFMTDLPYQWLIKLTEIIKRFPAGQKVPKFRMHSMHKQHIQILTSLTAERLDWMLGSPSLSPENKALFEKTLEKIKSLG